MDPDIFGILGVKIMMNNAKLNARPISRLRRNHSLEHATIHVLSKKFPKLQFGGMSTPLGFTIIGAVTSEDVAEAVVEALKRLRAGESDLAYHPNCGTNYAIPGLAAGIAAWLGSLGTDKKFKSHLERLPLMIFLATVALVLSRPLAPWVQTNLTTAPHPDSLELDRVETFIRGGMYMHRVTTRG